MQHQKLCFAYSKQAFTPVKGIRQRLQTNNFISPKTLGEKTNLHVDKSKAIKKSKKITRSKDTVLPKSKKSKQKHIEDLESPEASTFEETDKEMSPAK